MFELALEIAAEFSQYAIWWREGRVCVAVLGSMCCRTERQILFREMERVRVTDLQFLPSLAQEQPASSA